MAHPSLRTVRCVRPGRRLASLPRRQGRDHGRRRRRVPAAVRRCWRSPCGSARSRRRCRRRRCMQIARRPAGAARARPRRACTGRSSATSTCASSSRRARRWRRCVLIVSALALVVQIVRPAALGAADLLVRRLRLRRHLALHRPRAASPRHEAASAGTALRTAIYGAGDAGAQLAQAMQLSPESRRRSASSTTRRPAAQDRRRSAGLSRRAALERRHLPPRASTRSSWRSRRRARRRSATDRARRSTPACR